MQSKEIETSPGCYIDGARGRYAIDGIYKIAECCGFKLSNGTDQLEWYEKESFSEYEYAGELEDDIDAFMNENRPIEGHSWGRNEGGDWGLFLDEDC